MDINKIYESLCYYDSRNPAGWVQDKNQDDKNEPQTKGNYCCDNCFYGRTKLAEYIISLLKEREKNI